MQRSNLVIMPTFNELEQALASNQFFLVYQPIIKIEDDSITGMEALLRWHHPINGLISPDIFIPICEENKFIVPLGAWVCRSACSQLKKWHKMGYQHLYISVNLSTVQLHEPSLVDNIREMLTENNLSPHSLRLEITETQVMRDLNISMKILYELRQIGVQLSLDDFGTGYSSLTYLQQFSFNHLKIDKSFIKDLASNITSVGIVEAIIKLGHGLGLSVIAEGVEDKLQLDILKRMTCDYAQGYLFSKPISAQDFTANLLHNNTRRNVHRLQISPYHFTILTDQQREQTTQLITQFFCQHGPVTKYLGLTANILLPYAKYLIDQAIAGGMSIVAMQEEKVAACAIVLDLANPLQFANPSEPGLEVMLNFFYKCSENLFHEKVNTRGHIANLIITATNENLSDPSLASETNLKALELAKDKHFDFMCCAFIHSGNEKATLPYLINSKLRIRSSAYKNFFYNGEYPLKNLAGSVNAYIWELRPGAKLSYQIKDAM